jgi:uncharacterized protein with FMN-binding domain
MRRSTAAAVGTLTGAALIVGVRLSVSAPVVTAAPPAVDLANSGASPDPAGSKAPAKKKPADPAKQKTADETGGAAGADASGLKDGVYKGKASDYAYGTIQVSIKVDGGKITAADATYPITGNSATINPNAIAKLKQETLKVTTADDLNAVSGATLTSASYKESLQAALDAAGA